jgi:uncharacterized membrane protein YfcA
MTAEILALMSAHPRYVAALLLIISFLASYGCVLAFRKLEKSSPGWRRVLSLLLTGLAGMVCAAICIVSLGIASNCWYFLIVLVFPEIWVILYAACKSIPAALKMTAADCRKAPEPEVDSATKPE